MRRDADLLDEIRSTDPGSGFALWWLGQSGFLVKSAAGLTLLDPYLSDSLTRKYAATDKPHIRMTALPVRPELLPPIDLVTSTHIHTDHLDPDTLLPLLHTNPGLQLVIPEANRDFVSKRLGLPRGGPLGLDEGEALDAAGVRIHAIAAAHEEIERDDLDRCRYLGYILCFGGWTIYHSGDTVLYDGLTAALSTFDIDLALLPINGRRPERRVAGNLWGVEAARLAHDIGARLAVPCHYDMFEFNTESPDAFVKACAALGQPCRVLRCAERLASAEIE